MISPRISVETFWEYLAFALNSLVFLLIGLELFTPRTAQACAELRPQLADRELVLIDTGGLAPGEAAQLAALTDMLNVLAPHERHLVLPASMAAGVQSRMGELFAGLGSGSWKGREAEREYAAAMEGDL